MNRNYKKIVVVLLIMLYGSNCFNCFNLLVYGKNKSAFKNITICIDPGHQEKGNSQTESIEPNSKIKKAKVTSGTTGIYTRVPEYVLNLKISMKIKKILITDGFNVVMTRDKNEVNLSNIDRANIANKAKANLFLRIHADGSTNKNTNGISILYPAENLKNKEISRISKIISQEVLNSLIKSTAAKYNGVNKRYDMTGFNWSKVPTILVEAGFMSNLKEDKLLENNDYENKIAFGIVKGIEKYLLDLK